MYWLTYDDFEIQNLKMCQFILGRSLLSIKTIKWTMACALLLLCGQSEVGIHCADILACQSANTVKAREKEGDLTQSYDNKKLKQDKNMSSFPSDHELPHPRPEGFYWGCLDGPLWELVPVRDCLWNKAVFCRHPLMC